MRKNVLNSLDGSGVAIQDPAIRRQEVAHDLIAVSYRQRRYVSAAGKTSNYHLDPALFMTRPTLLRRLASLLAEQIGHDVDRIAGSEPGSIALAAATALHSGLPFVSLRLGEGDGGIEVCGELHANERVVLIEDVLSSGSKALQGANAISEERAQLVSILGVLDRSEGASEAIAAAGIDFISLYSMSDLDKNERSPQEPPAQVNEGDGSHDG